MLCGYTDDARRLNGYKVHAAALRSKRRAVTTRSSGSSIIDTDFEITADEVALQDEAEFHEHARTMGYPDEIVRGAWTGISMIAVRYTNGDWPFDGSMQEWVDRA